MNFLDDHAWMRLLELLLNDFGLKRKSIFIFLVQIIGILDSDRTQIVQIVLLLIRESLKETYLQLYQDGGGIPRKSKDFSIDLWRVM